ncbi:hypothetical protein [Jidongwangia harbinensis]|uniref:hypothetical protein n=1 Tax=Jidongwangia harbinensis TaxID=2878561 RepID=UPI001CD94DAD|nr:hypothetical protein [Jidongwangia harbinensis]MCA2211500.1 hypothetical protein [Jidongwangia harbinensis]
MASTHDHRRTGTRTVLAALLLGTVLATAACGAGGEDPPARPSGGASTRATDRTTADEPDPTRTRDAERTAAPTETTVRPPTSPAAEEPAPTRTTRTAAPAETTDRPPTSRATEEPEPDQTTRTTVPAAATARPPAPTVAAEPEPVPTTRTTTPAATTTPAPAGSVSAAVAVAGTSGPSLLACTALLLLVGALVVGGVLLSRSQQRSAWDTEARALESETRTVTAVRLPPVLSTSAAARRGLAWPPVRADLTDVQGRWNSLTERASGDARRNWSLQLSGRLAELIAAVDAESEEMAAGRNWMLLRPRVNRAEHALAAVLAGRPEPEPPAAGDPGTPAFQP